MVEGIVGDTVEENKDPAIGAEQGFAVEWIGGTKAMAVMAQLVVLGDMRVFYQVIYNTNTLENPAPSTLGATVHNLFFVLNF